MNLFEVLFVDKDMHMFAVIRKRSVLYVRFSNVLAKEGSFLKTETMYWPCVLSGVLVRPLKHSHSLSVDLQTKEML